MDKAVELILCITNDLFRSVSIALIATTFILYYYFTWTFDFWSQRGVPYVKPTIIFGNFTDVLLFKKSLPESVKTMYDNFAKNRYAGVYRVRSPILFIRDPDLVRRVCVKDFACFTNRGIPVNREDPLSGHLFNLENKEWRQMRTKLAPTFTSFKIKRMFNLLIDCHEILRKTIIEITSICGVDEGCNVEIRELTIKFTIDVIGTCAFGININALRNENSSFKKMAKRLGRPSYRATLWRMLRTALPKLYKILGVRVVDPEVTRFFTEIVSRMITERESEEGRKRGDFMDLLVELKHKRNSVDRDDEGNEKNFDDEKIVEEIEFDDNAIAAQAFVFFVAGNETSSNTIAFCLHELALNEKIQQKVRREIIDRIDNAHGKLTYETVQEMKYLDMIVLETLRKYPPAPILSRRCAYPWKIPDSDVEVPAGMRVVIPIYGIHHDPNYYPQPEVFDPDRFAEETKATRPRYTYLPFGEGPRNCIGMRFAMIQTKIGIISFLRDHRIDICEKTVVPIKFSRRSLVTSSEGGFWLKIKKIT